VQAVNTPPAPSPAASAPYRERHPARSRFVKLRGLDYHVNTWHEDAGPALPPLVMVHGWMDVGASFQFVVDAMAGLEGARRRIFAPDWRGFGLTQGPATDTYWFPDYLADLDALLDALAPGEAVDLVGHSMGGNVVMSYAGVRPQRIRRLVNLEGFGLPRTEPRQAPGRMAQWLDQLKEPQVLRDYPGPEAVAERLRANNPLLPADRAAWLATRWARPDAQGRWQILGDAAHKRVNPVLYRVEELLETWKRITAPVLWVDGDRTDVEKWWAGRYPREEFEQRIAVVGRLGRHRVSSCGHLLHHDQPAALAERLLAFLDEPA